MYPGSGRPSSTFHCMDASLTLFRHYTAVSDCMSGFCSTMLPAAAVFYFPWEVNSGVVRDGESVRVFGRLTCYQPEESRATLSAQHASKEHHVAIHTGFVEPFNPIIGAQYIVLGELENAEGVREMVRARVLNCVDGVNIALLQKAINEQRSFFREREQRQEDAAQPAPVT